MDDDAVFEMPPHRACQHGSLDVAANAFELREALPVRDALDVLLDDRPLVEHFGDVVRGRADDLDAPLERPAVGVGSHERRQEGAVDVDSRRSELREEPAEEWTTRHLETRYRALRRSELEAVAREVGFRSIRWLEPSETGYYQPIMEARRA